jgi:hypothetical protein
LHVMVEHDPVLVVADLGFVPKLDRLAQPAFPDRAGVRVVQTDPPSRTVGCGPGQPLPGLLDNPTGRLQQVGQVVDRPSEPAPPTTRRGIVAAAAYGLPASARALRRARFPFRSKRSASSAAVSARSASSALLRRTTAEASSLAAALRVRSFAFRS